MQEFTVGAQRIRYVVYGAGEPVVTIANLAAAPGSGWPDVSSLTKAGYQVIAPQHLGPEPSSILEMAADMGGLLDHLKVGAARIWGYSQGAMVAQELALLRPDVVRAAVLMGTVGRQGAFLNVYFGAARSFLDTPQDFPDALAMLSLIQLSPELLGNDTVVASFADALRSGTAFDVTDLRRSMHAESTYDHRLESLREVNVPCMVIAFELDLRCLPALGREVADAIPGCRYVQIPGAAHMGAMTHSAEVTRCALDFFATV